MRRIVLIQGHPDPAGGHLGHALANSYAEGALSAGHELRRIEVAALDFPLLRSKHDFEHHAAPPALQPPQAALLWAEHLVFLYPLWLGDMPAHLKGFLEQVLRPGFAFDYLDGGKVKMHLRGRSARVVVTMGMPALAYRWFYRAHSVNSFERNILRFVGIKPVKTSFYGMVESVNEAKRLSWQKELHELGRKAA